MSAKTRRRPDPLKARASAFAALGDETRLLVVRTLSEGIPQSISRLTGGGRLSRQAVTKHLRVLEDAGVVQSTRAGRECLYTLHPKSLDEMRDYLDRVSAQWDDALARLAAHLDD